MTDKRFAATRTQRDINSLIDDLATATAPSFVVEAASGALSAESVLGTTVITTAAQADRQAAAIAGRLFLPSDGFCVYRDTGSAWAPWGPVFPLTDPAAASIDTWVNQGGATSDATKGGIYIAVPGGAGAGWRILKKTAPAPPYTVTWAMLPMLLNTSNQGAGFIWRQNSTGELCHVGIQRNAGTGTYRLCVRYWSNLTTASTQYYDDALPANPTLIWWKCADDNTNRVVSLSMDGQHWTEIDTTGRTADLTADEIGFAVYNDDATYGCGSTLISWRQT